MENFVEKEDFELFKRNLEKTIKAKANKRRAETRTLSGEFNMKNYHSKIQFIDPAGSDRTIYLPTVVMLDGASWHTKVYCQKGEEDWCEDVCPKFLHWYVGNSPYSAHITIVNLADASENLVIKWKKTTYLTQASWCNPQQTKKHYIPILQSEEVDQGTILTIGQNEIGEFYCSGEQWRGFLGKTT